MGTAVRTTADATQLPTSIRTTYTTPLRAAFVAGNKINASDITLLRDFANLVLTHTHSLEEYGRIADYGNTGQTNGPYTSTTNAAQSAVTVTVSAGSTINAADHTTIQNAANNMRVHSHAFTDNVN